MMKVIELIKALQKVEDQDLPVYVVADHSQSPEMCNGIDGALLEDDTYGADEIHKDDYEANPQDYPNAVKVLLVYGT